VLLVLVLVLLVLVMLVMVLGVKLLLVDCGGPQTRLSHRGTRGDGAFLRHLLHPSGRGGECTALESKGRGSSDHRGYESKGKRLGHRGFRVKSVGCRV